VRETQDISGEALQRIQNGDRAAFGQLMEMYLRLVTHITARMVHNLEDQKDLCQEIFLKIYLNLGTFRHESKLSTWIAKIAYHTCLNHLQKKRTLLMDDVSPQNQLPELPDFDGFTPDSAFEERDVNEKIQREIARLPVRYRTILTLYHLDEMSYQEIAQVMSLPQGTVKSYLFRARRMLKAKLLTHYRKEELCGQAI
jgi:RNA polymerase sigma factor (sigma-70 family)